MHQKIYLDNNSSTSLDPQVLEIIHQSLQMMQGNPSSIHSFGKQISSSITKARDTIATCLKVKPTELNFTSGGTENANMILRGVFANNQKKHLITSTIEHSCVYKTAQYLEKLGVEVTYLSPDSYGIISREAVKAAIRPNTALVALMAVNNETGVKTDIGAIAEITEQHKIPFFVDGVALLGKDPFILHKGISAMGFSGHKIHAPQGIGVVFVRSGFKFQPLLIGGEQEFGKRAGTENVLGIIALGKAFELAFNDIEAIHHKIKKLRDLFEQLLFERLSNVSVNGGRDRVANVSNLSFKGVDGEGLLIALDAAGVSASHGSACSSGALEPSRVLVNMGLPINIVQSSIRFSFSRFTTEEEVIQAVEIITKVVFSLST